MRELTKAETVELSAALSQPYYYQCRGGQVFVFFSADGKYVMKFFRQRLFRPSWLLNHDPLPKILHLYRNKCNWKRQDELKRDFLSYKTCFEELHDESALLYCHLNHTSDIKRRLEIIDPLKIHHFIQLDQFDFIVQRRAKRIFDWIAEEPVDVAEGFSQILTLIDTYIKKGFNNRDPFIPNNCGLFENRAILIDVGAMVKNDFLKTEEGHKAEFKRITDKFALWLEANYPEHLPAFHEVLK